MQPDKVLIVEAPLVKLKSDGANVAAVRTNHPKISPLLLAAIVKKAVPGACVKIADMKAAAPDKEIKFKETQYGAGRIDVYRVGADFTDIEAEITATDTILLTNNFAQNAGITGDLIEFCKKTNPKAKVFVGGSDAQVKTKDVDRQAYFYGRGANIVCAGDGEIALPAALHGRIATEARFLQNLNEMPLLPFELVELGKYTESNEGPLPAGVKPPLMYFETSRGCRQCCDFCPTPFVKGKYRTMGIAKIKKVLLQYESAGILTILLCEDNILSRLGLPNGRAIIIEWFEYMRDQGFAWEFINGVEIGKLLRNGESDKELIEALFRWDGKVGCYRSYVPLERLDAQKYAKLKSVETEKNILEEIVQQGTARFNLGVVIGGEDETQGALSITEQKLKGIMESVVDMSGGKSLPYANVFLHTPLPGSRDYGKLHRENRIAFDINKDMELFNFYTSVINGRTFSYNEMTELREAMATRLNGKEAMRVWKQTGKYYYGFGG